MHRRSTRPAPSSVAAERRLVAQVTKDTGPELMLRRALHRAGLRYRVHLRAVTGSRREIDIAFPGAKVAIFVDGCFWHGCDEHPRSSKAHSAWWARKIAENRSRDADTDQRLLDDGWTVIRVWEHETPSEAADRVARAVRARSGLRDRLLV